MKCLCPACGGDDPLYSELHRRQCEARHVLKMRKEQRQAYYQGVLKGRRGEAAARLLIEDIEAEAEKQEIPF
mgnify:CR=1 FL=1